MYEPCFNPLWQYPIYDEVFLLSSKIKSAVCNIKSITERNRALFYVDEIVQFIQHLGDATKSLFKLPQDSENPKKFSE